MIAGTIYGVVLNDREQREQLAVLFEAPPYKAPPQRPVLYIKSRNCIATGGGTVLLPPDLTQVEAAPTLGLLIGRDARRVTAQAALSHVAGACLALDVCEPQDNFYRPPVRQRCRDGFLPLGEVGAFSAALLDCDIETRINDAVAQTWSPRRLLRDAATLIADVSAFMTLAAGDLLLVGLPHDAPRAQAGDHINVRAGFLPGLTARFRAEVAA
jgi:5-oxopent-3-ene-1,2,5-tricarboxylate decarboxylase/2-hydroxyhepta-2,4-diene-1,7-dioate isomerase